MSKAQLVITAVVLEGLPLMRQPRTESPPTRSTRCEQKSAHAAGSLRTDAACSLSLPMPMS